MIKTPIGKLVKIRRYPVKSMGGEDLNKVYVHETGLTGDRVYAYYDPNSGRPGLPYITVRENNEMLLLSAQIVDEVDDKPFVLGHNPEVRVNVRGKDLKLTDDKVFSFVKKNLTSYHHNLKLDYRNAGMHDTKPISIVSMQSIQRLSEERGQGELDPLRFRSNFYVVWDNDEPFYEQKLVGNSILIGDDVVLHISHNNIRCTIINVDPKTGEKDSSVLKTVAQKHDVKFGIYGEVRSCGVVEKDNTIYLIEG